MAKTEEMEAVGQLSLMKPEDLFRQAYNAAEDIAGEFELVDKSKLVEVPFVILDFRFSDGLGATGQKVSVEVMTKTGEKLVFNDGSTGVFTQIADHEEDWKDQIANGRPILISNGLRVSEYTYKAPDGSEKPAKTYYLDAR